MCRFIETYLVFGDSFQLIDTPQIVESHGTKMFGTEISQYDGKTEPHPAEVVFSLDILCLYLLKTSFGNRNKLIYCIFLLFINKRLPGINSRVKFT